LEAFIRGMTPWPGAFTFCKNTRLKIFGSTPIMIPVDKAPGTVLKGFPMNCALPQENGLCPSWKYRGSPESAF
ncbi:MAG: hypothetical protein ABIC39_00035, partial [Pseudomonadota bacterium]